MPQDPNNPLVPQTGGEEERLREERRRQREEALRSQAGALPAEVDQPDPPAGRGFWRGLVNGLDSIIDLRAPTPVGIGLRPDVFAAVGRGVTKAVDETWEFLAEDIGAPLVSIPLEAMVAGPQRGAVIAATHAAGIDQGPTLETLLHTKEEEEIFAEWYDKRDTNETALFGKDWREAHLAYQNDTWAVRAVEFGTQFMVGFWGAGKIRGLAGGATWASRLVRAAGRGAVADFTVFDPHEERLSNLAQHFGISNMVTDFLAADSDDPRLLGRMKNAMEGILPGMIIDGIMEAARGLRVASQARAGKIKPDDAIAQLDEIASGRPVEDPGPTRATVTESGPVIEMAPSRVREVPVKGDRPGLSLETPDGIIKANPVEGGDWAITSSRAIRSGEGMGTRLYTELAAEVEARGGLLRSSTEFMEEDAEQLWRSLVRKGMAEELPEGGWRMKPGVEPVKAKAPDPVPAKSIEDAQMQSAAMNSVVERAQRPIGESLRQSKEWIARSEELARSGNIEDLVKFRGEPDLPLGRIDDSRDIIASAIAAGDMLPVQLVGKGGRMISHAETRQLAEGLFHGVDGDTVLKWAADTFGETERLPQMLLGLRDVMVAHVRNTRHLSKLLDYAPESPWLAEQLAQAMEVLFDLQGNVSGIASNVGRTLESQKIPVGAGAGVPRPQQAMAEALAEYKAAKSLLDSAQASGDADAVRAALRRLDEVGELMGQHVGGRPKSKTGLASIFDRDARRQARAQAAGEQGELLPDALPPKPNVREDMPAALAWYEQAAGKVSQQLDEARAAAAAATEPRNPSQAYRSFRDMSKEDIRRLARMLFMSDDIDVESILGQIILPDRMIRQGASTVGDRMVAIRLGLMLSGPKTHLTNMFSNLAFMHLRGAEYFWAGVPARRVLPWDKLTSRQRGTMREAGLELVGGYWSAFGESWEMARKAFRAGGNILDQGAMRGDLRQVANIEQLGPVRGILARFNPSRWLMAGDELAQQMSYRSNIRMNLLKQAAEANIPPEQVAEWIVKHMDLAFNEQGRGVIPGALNFSRDVTFKSPLPRGTIGNAVQRMSQNKALRFTVLPFVRTPANLIYRNIERLPGVAMLQRAVREELKAGGERAALAQAKMELGGAMLATAALGTYMGFVTGGGPADPQLRSEWMRLGNKPYTIRIPGSDVEVRYNLLDPVMMAFGQMADLVSAAGGTEDEESMQDAAATIFAVTVDRMADKWYFQQAVEILGALTSGNPNKIQNAASRWAAGFVPAAARQLVTDEIRRQTWDTVDRVKAQVPGFSKTLEPQRNIVGHPVLRAPGTAIQQINPFEVSFRIENHEAWDKLVGLNRAFGMPDHVLRVGSAEIDLTRRGYWIDDRTPAAQRKQSPYDRWLELCGQVTFGGETLEQRLVRIAMSEEFDEATQTGTVHEGGEAYMMIAREIDRYQRKARSQVFQEYRPLRDEIRRLRRLGGAEARSRLDRIGELSRPE